jgi:hypothetical protein
LAEVIRKDLVGDKHLVNTEQVAFMVVYDIPSEGFKFLQKTDKDTEPIKHIKTDAIHHISSVRLTATRWLHDLGLPSSNSVLLIPAGTTDETIDQTVINVEKKYKELNEYLKVLGLQEIGSPFIRKVPIVRFQFSLFRDMAEKNLRDKLDQQLDNLAHKLNELSNLEDAKKKSLSSRYKYEMKEIDDMKELAKRLDINVDDKFELLTALVSKAISVVS